MKVKELIELLQKEDQEAYVCYLTDKGLVNLEDNKNLLICGGR